MRKWASRAWDSPVVGPAVVCACAAWLLYWLPGRWIAHDDGVVAHSAERVLSGELPHRDFDDLYTGGLSALHALGMHVFGVDLYSLRTVLWFFAVAGIAFVYGICRRSFSPPAAAVITLGAMAMSFPNYPASMASWYVTVFSLGALYFIIMWEGRRRVWLLAAGLLAGCTVLIKLPGLYTVAAGFVTVWYGSVRRHRQTDVQTGSSSALLRAAVVVAAALLLAGLTWTLHTLASIEVLFLFLVPNLCVACAWVHAQWTAGRGAFRTRAAALIADVGVYTLGAALPVLMIVGLYAWHGALADLWRGVWLLPQRRLLVVTLDPPSWRSMLWGLPLLLALSAPWRGDRRPHLLTVLLLALWAAASLVLGHIDEVHQLTWAALRTAIPLSTAVGAWHLMRRARAGTPAPLSHFAVLCMSGWLNLMQFPFAFGIYFLYVAPIAVLAVAHAAALAGTPWVWRGLWWGAQVGFFVLWVTGTQPSVVGLHSAPTSLEPLAVPRGNLLVPGEEALVYGVVVEAIQKLTPPDAYIYASVDCPEVYFLSARRNPTPTLHEFSDRDVDDPPARRRRILESLDRHRVNVFVKCTAWRHSRIDETLLKQLDERFPRALVIWPFEVRWR